MPTKIITGNSDHLAGVISQTDLEDITNTFENNCAISAVGTTIPAGRQFTKINAVKIPIKAMKQLISSADNADTDFIKIKFGITLPNQLDCQTGTKSEGNQLTVVLLIEENNAIGERSTAVTGRNKKANFVLTTGFRASQPVKAGQDTLADPCCPWEGGNNG